MEKSESTAAQSIKKFKAVVAKGPANPQGPSGMDKESKPNPGDPAINSAWEADVTKLIEVYNTMDCPSYFEIYLPFGWCQFRAPQVQFIEFAGMIGHEFHEMARFSDNEYMRLFIQNTKGRRRLGLRQSFYKVPNAGQVVKQRGFSYQWGDKKTTIYNSLGTTDIKKIRAQIHKLLTECKRFLFMYCNIETTKRKKN